MELSVKAGSHWPTVFTYLTNSGLSRAFRDLMASPCVTYAAAPTSTWAMAQVITAPKSRAGLGTQESPSIINSGGLSQTIREAIGKATNVHIDTIRRTLTSIAFADSRTWQAILTSISITEIIKTVWKWTIDDGNILFICFCTSTGTKVQGYQYVDTSNQRWELRRVSRSASNIQALVRANPFTPDGFRSYVQDGLYNPFFFSIIFILRLLLIRYIVLPPNLRQDIYNSTGLSTTRWRKEIFDCMLNVFTEDHELILLQSRRRWLCICCQSGNRKVGKWKYSRRCMLPLRISLVCTFLLMQTSFGRVSPFFLVLCLGEMPPAQGMLTTGI